MERKIGEEFEYNGVRLRVTKRDLLRCDDCFYKSYLCGLPHITEHIGWCCPPMRKDRVKFIKVEENMKNQETKSLLIPEGWEFAGYENGEVKIRKVEPEFPTTYEEAVDVINYDILTRMLVPQNMSRPVTALCNLLVCRNAWWQKLGWKPDFRNGLVAKYTFANYGEKMLADVSGSDNNILAFPTREVRDKFAETFKDLIEEAKELL